MLRAGKIERSHVARLVVRVAVAVLHAREQVAEHVIAVADGNRRFGRLVEVVILFQAQAQIAHVVDFAVVLMAVAVEVHPNAVAEPDLFGHDGHARAAAHHALVLVVVRILIGQPGVVVRRGEIQRVAFHFRRGTFHLDQQTLAAAKLAYLNREAADVLRRHAVRPARCAVKIRLILAATRNGLVGVAHSVIRSGRQLRHFARRAVPGHAQALERHVPRGTALLVVVVEVIAGMRQFVHHDDVARLERRDVLHQNPVTDHVGLAVPDVRARDGDRAAGDKVIQPGNKARHILGNLQRVGRVGDVVHLRKQRMLIFKARHRAARLVAGLTPDRAGHRVALHVRKRHAVGVAAVLHGLRRAHRVSDVVVNARVALHNLLQHQLAVKQRIHGQRDGFARFELAFARHRDRSAVLRDFALQGQAAAARRCRHANHKRLPRQHIQQNRVVDGRHVFRLVAFVLENDGIARAVLRADGQHVAQRVVLLRHRHQIRAVKVIVGDLRALHQLGDGSLRQAERRIDGNRRARLAGSLLRLFLADIVGQAEFRRVAHFAHAIDNRLIGALLFDAHRHPNRRFLLQPGRDGLLRFRFVFDSEARVGFRVERHGLLARGYVQALAQQLFALGVQAVHVRKDRRFRRRAAGRVKAHPADGHAVDVVQRLHGLAVQPRAALLVAAVHRPIIHLLIRDDESTHRITDGVAFRVRAVAGRVGDGERHSLPIVILKVVQRRVGALLPVDRDHALAQIRLALRDVRKRNGSITALVRQRRLGLRIPRHILCGLRRGDVAVRGRRFGKVIRALFNVGRDDVGIAIPVRLVIRLIRRKRVRRLADGKRLGRIRARVAARRKRRKRIALLSVVLAALLRAELRAGNQRLGVFVVALEDHQLALRLVIRVEMQRTEKLVRVLDHVFIGHDGVIARMRFQRVKRVLRLLMAVVRRFKFVIVLVILADRVQVRAIRRVADRASVRVRLFKDDVGFARLQPRQVREEHVAVLVGYHLAVEIRLACAVLARHVDLRQRAVGQALHDVQHCVLHDRRILAAVLADAAEYANLHGNAARVHHRNRRGSARRQFDRLVVGELIAGVRRVNLFDVVGIARAVNRRILRGVYVRERRHAVFVGGKLHRARAAGRPVAERRALRAARVVALHIVLVRHIQREGASRQRAGIFFLPDVAGLVDGAAHQRVAVEEIHLHLPLDAVVHHVVFRDGHVPAADDSVVFHLRAVVAQPVRRAVFISRGLREPVARARAHALLDGVRAGVETHNPAGAAFILGEAERKRIARFAPLARRVHVVKRRQRAVLLIDGEGDFRTRAERLRLRRLKRLADFQIRARRVGHGDDVRVRYLGGVIRRLAFGFQHYGGRASGLARVRLPGDMRRIRIADDADIRDKGLVFAAVNLIHRDGLDELVQAGIQPVKGHIAVFIRRLRAVIVVVTRRSSSRVLLGEILHLCERTQQQPEGNALQRLLLAVFAVGAVADLVNRQARRRRVVHRDDRVSGKRFVPDVQLASVEEAEVAVHHAELILFRAGRIVVIVRFGDDVARRIILIVPIRAVIQHRQAERRLAVFVRLLPGGNGLAIVAVQNHVPIRAALFGRIGNLDRRALLELLARVLLDDGQRAERRVHRAHDDFAHVFAGREGQAVGRRLHVRIAVHAHKAAPVGLHPVDNRRGGFLEDEGRVARKLHGGLIVVFAVQRDRGIQRSIRIIDGIHRVRAVLAAVIARAVHILGQGKVRHFAQQVLDGAFRARLAVRVRHGDRVHVLRLIDRHMQVILFPDVDHVDRVCRLAEDEIGLVGLAVRAQRHGIGRARGQVLLVKLFERNGDAHAVARLKPVFNAGDELRLERAFALDRLKQAVLVLLRQNQLEGHARQVCKAVGVVPLHIGASRPILLIQLDAEQAAEFGLFARHNVGLVIRGDLLHVVDNRAAHGPEAAENRLIGTRVVDLHLAEHEGVIGDIAVQLERIRHERARILAARARLVGDIVGERILRSDQRKDALVRQRRGLARIRAALNGFAHARRGEAAVHQRVQLVLGQRLRADGVNLELAVIQRLIRTGHLAAGRVAAAEQHRVAQLVQLELRVILVVGDDAVGLLVLVGRFLPGQLDVFEILQIVQRGRLGLAIALILVVAVRLGIGAVALRRFRLHEHITLETVQAGNRQRRVGHRARAVNPRQFAVLAHFVERHFRARQRIERRVALLQLEFLLAIQPNRDFRFRLVFKGQRLIRVLVQGEVLFRLAAEEIIARRFRLLDGVGQRRIRVVRIAVNRQTGQFKRLIVALFGRVNQLAARLVRRKAQLGQRRIGIAARRNIRRIDGNRERRLVAVIRIVNRGIRIAELLFLLINQLDVQFADVRFVFDSFRVLRRAVLRIGQRADLRAVQLHVAGNGRFPDVVRAVGRDGERARHIRVLHGDGFNRFRAGLVAVQREGRKAARLRAIRELLGHRQLVLLLIHLPGGRLLARAHGQVNQRVVQVVARRGGQLLHIISRSVFGGQIQRKAAVLVRREAAGGAHRLRAFQMAVRRHGNRGIIQRQHAIFARRGNQIAASVCLLRDHSVFRARKQLFVAAALGEYRLADLTGVGHDHRLVVIRKRHVLRRICGRIAALIRFALRNGIGDDVSFFVPAAQIERRADGLLAAVRCKLDGFARQPRTFGNLDVPRPRRVLARHIDEPLFNRQLLAADEDVIHRLNQFVIFGKADFNRLLILPHRLPVALGVAEQTVGRFSVLDGHAIDDIVALRILARQAHNAVYNSRVHSVAVRVRDDHVVIAEILHVLLIVLRIPTQVRRQMQLALARVVIHRVRRGFLRADFNLRGGHRQVAFLRDLLKRIRARREINRGRFSVMGVHREGLAALAVLRQREGGGKRLAFVLRAVQRIEVLGDHQRAVLRVVILKFRVGVLLRRHNNRLRDIGRAVDIDVAVRRDVGIILRHALAHNVVRARGQFLRLFERGNRSRRRRARLDHAMAVRIHFRILFLIKLVGHAAVAVFGFRFFVSGQLDVLLGRDEAAVAFHVILLLFGVGRIAALRRVAVALIRQRRVQLNVQTAFRNPLVVAIQLEIALVVDHAQRVIAENVHVRVVDAVRQRRGVVYRAVRRDGIRAVRVRGNGAGHVHVLAVSAEGHHDLLGINRRAVVFNRLKRQVQPVLAQVEHAELGIGCVVLLQNAVADRAGLDVVGEGHVVIVILSFGLLIRDLHSPGLGRRVVGCFLAHEHRFRHGVIHGRAVLAFGHRAVLVNHHLGPQLRRDLDHAAQVNLLGRVLAVIRQAGIEAARLEVHVVGGSVHAAAQRDRLPVFIVDKLCKRQAIRPARFAVQRKLHARRRVDRHRDVFIRVKRDVFAVPAELSAVLGFNEGIVMGKAARLSEFQAERQRDRPAGLDCLLRRAERAGDQGGRAVCHRIAHALSKSLADLSISVVFRQRVRLRLFAALHVDLDCLAGNLFGNRRRRAGADEHRGRHHPRQNPLQMVHHFHLVLQLYQSSSVTTKRQ